MEKELEEWPEALATTARIAADCRCDLELNRIHLPRFPFPHNRSARLLRLCRQGIKRRYRESSPRIEGRLRRELNLISRLGLDDYFLLVEDIVNHARRRGIPTLGRGSAANSLVCFLLGITDVDPIRYDLYFERFLNPGRSDPPDIDLDFPTSRREEILSYIRRRFGADRTAMLSTTVRFQARSALRAAARFLGMSAEAAGRLTRNLPYAGSLGDPERIRREFPECRRLPWEEKWFQRLLALGRRLEGIPRHLSVHPGGVVLAPRPLTDFLALERSSSGIVVTQPDMYAVKKLGLLKLDILGQRSLAVVSDVLKELAKKGVSLDFSRRNPARDHRTRNLVAAGKTIGCFYIESPVMRHLLRRLKCREFETLVAASSIIRPGVSSTGCAESYIRRQLGQEEIPSIHPRVDPILAETRGVIIYQEQVMRLVTEAAGMSPAAADQFRRTMSKKPGWGSLKNYRRQFLSGAEERTIPPATARELWRQISGFAAYAFCKAHSASFALLSYRAAYLKAHHPAEFLAAVLSNRGGFYPPREYIREAGRRGLKIYPPDINRSVYRYQAERAGIRMGLMAVKRLKFQTSSRIIAGREEREYNSWPDFIERVYPEKGELRSLILSGALDRLGESRRSLLWQAEILSSRLPGEDLFSRPPDIPKPTLPACSPPFSHRRLMEVESFGFSLSPPAAVRSPHSSARIPWIRADQQYRWPEREVQLIGEVVTGRLTRTGKSSRLMKFLTMEDETGLFEVILFPDCYACYGHHLNSSGPLYIRGKVRLRDSVPTIICSFLAALETEESEKGWEEGRETIDEDRGIG